MRNSANAQQIEIGWWPGDARYPHAAFFAFAFPAPEGLGGATLSPPGAHWDVNLGEYVLNWDDVSSAPDPFRAALDFGLSAIRHASRCAAGIRVWPPVPWGFSRQSSEQ